MDFKKLLKNKIVISAIAALVVIAGLFMIFGGNKNTHITDINKSFVTPQEGKELVQKYQKNNQSFVLFFPDRDFMEDMNESQSSYPSGSRYLSPKDLMLKVLNINNDPKIIINAESLEDDEFWSELGEPEEDGYDWRHEYSYNVEDGDTAAGRFKVVNHKITFVSPITEINGKEISKTK